MVFIVLAALLLCGCATFELPDPSYSLPEVIHQSSLPPWPFHTDHASINLVFRVYIGLDGTVGRAQIETPSGSRAWDSLALAEVRRWKYSPALMNGRPTAIWLRQLITMHFDNPLYMKIAELACSEETAADSVYAMLVAGASFDSLARQHSVSDSRTRGGVLGEIDLHTLPLHISRQVAALHPGEYTKPLKRGRQFVIFKRVGSGV